MELRPRRGRSAQTPSTPSTSKPSPRQANRSTSRRKPTQDEALSGKEKGSKVPIENMEKSQDMLRNICEEDNTPSNKSLKEMDQYDSELFKGNERNLEKPVAAVVGEEDVSNHYSETTISEEVQHKNLPTGRENVQDIRKSLGSALEGHCDKGKTKAMHVENNNASDDDNEHFHISDEDEDDLASIFARSMKAHLHNCEPSIFGKSVAMQTEQSLQKGGESLCLRDALKEFSLDNNIDRSAGPTLSWAPKVGLSALKKAPMQQVRSLKTKMTNIWDKDQDGLCVLPIDPVKLNKLARKQKKDTTGDKWYNMSATTITPELKKELQLVKLRGVLDPKRHYKAEDSKGLSKYFQVGTVIGGPADYYSGRLTKKEQKNSLADEILSDSSVSAYRKRKYLEIQDQMQAGGKRFMKLKKKKRTPAWANI